MSKQEKIKQLVADLGWDYDRLSNGGQKTYDEICSLLDIESEEKLTFKAREGRETFLFEAFNEEEARESCDMWNATFLGQVNEKGNLLPLA